MVEAINERSVIIDAVEADPVPARLVERIRGAGVSVEVVHGIYVFPSRPGDTQPAWNNIHSATIRECMEGLSRLNRLTQSLEEMSL